MIYIISIIVIILFAGFINMAEIAFLNLNDEMIEERFKDKKDLLKVLKKIRKKFSQTNSLESKEKIINHKLDWYDSFFGMVTLLTTISLIIISYLFINFINENIVYLNEVSTLLNIVIYIVAILFLCCIFLVFGILIPRSLGKVYAVSIISHSAIFIYGLVKIFEYPSKWILSFSNFILKPFKSNTSFSHFSLSEEEIKILLSRGIKTGSINETEQEIIENIFEFNDLKAYEVVIPRTEMIAVEYSEDTEKMFYDILKTGHTLVPIYEETLDNIIGLIHIKDLLKSFTESAQKENWIKSLNIKGLIRPAYFVPENKYISEILKEMQKRGERMAIVTDEFGGTEGVITLEDILGEIVGEIASDNSVIDEEYFKLPDGKFIVLGSMFIDDFNDTFNFDLPTSEEYNTVAGFISYHTGKILNAGEKYNYETDSHIIEFELIKKVRQKMVQFKISIIDKSSDEKDNHIVNETNLLESKSENMTKPNESK